jgi:anti-anti-sigma factor
MDISDRKINKNLWLVSVDGRLDQQETELFETYLTKLLDKGHNRLLIDLSEVTYVNSGGLRCLVTVWRKAQEQGGDVFLCSLNERISQLFDVVGFSKVFNIYSSQDSAIQDLTGKNHP